jgi:hypothetical protein
VNLPAPDCATDRIGCILQPALNRLDGFNLQPRIRVRFSGPIMPDSLPNGVFFVALDNIVNDEYGLNQTGDVVAINEVVYDPATFSAFAKPDSFLDQHRRYALIVTTGVRDSNGDPVSPSPAFLACQSNTASPGCLSSADLNTIPGALFPSSSLVTATTFTTLSATTWLSEPGITWRQLFRTSKPDLWSTSPAIPTPYGISKRARLRFPLTTLPCPSLRCKAFRASLLEPTLRRTT